MPFPTREEAAGTLLAFILGIVLVALFVAIYALRF